MVALVPIHSDALEGTAHQWLPFVEAIARRTGCHVGQLVALVMSNQVQPLLAWEPEENRALAMCGTSIIERGDKRIGEIVWATGSGREHWFPLIADVERYHKVHLDCSGMKAIARPGWKRDLQDRGYRMTHIVMERDI